MPEGDYRRVFVDNLRYYMQLNEKNQQSIIDDLGYCSSTVSSWCTGKKLPRMDKIQKLAEYFGIDKSDLIEEMDQGTPEMTNDRRVSDAAGRRLFSYYAKLNPAGRKKLLDRADELVQLGYTNEATGI